MNRLHNTTAPKIDNNVIVIHTGQIKVRFGHAFMSKLRCRRNNKDVTKYGKQSRRENRVSF